MRNTAIVLALLAVVALAVPAFGATYVTTNWTGTTGAYYNDANWDVGAPVYPKPTSDTYYAARVANGGTCQVTSAGDIWQFSAGNWYSPGHWEFLPGSAPYTFLLSTTTVGYNNLITAPANTVIQSGGDLGGSNCNLSIGPGTYDAVKGARGNGSWTISGGSLTQINSTNRYTRVGNVGTVNGVGMFKVVGTGPTLIQLASYTQYADSTLGIVLDAAGDVTKINVYNNATLAGELLLDASAYSGEAKTIDVLTTSGGTLDYSGLSLDAASLAAGSSLTDDGAGTLQINYVPEPATMVLLGIGGIGVLIRRKRR